MKSRLAALFVAIVMIVVGETNAQPRIGDYAFTSLNVSSGQGTITSGLDLTAIFKDDSRILEFTGNSDRVYSQHFWSLDSTTALAASVGFFKNTPWLAYQIRFLPTEYLVFSQWLGFSAGNPNTDGWEIQQLFHNVSAYLVFDDFTVGCAAIKFLGPKWDFLPGLALNLDINGSFQGLVGADYSYLEKRPLFRIGVKYKI